MINKWEHELDQWKQCNIASIKKEYEKQFKYLEKEILSFLEATNYNYNETIEMLLVLIGSFEGEAENVKQEIMLSILKWNCWDLAKDAERLRKTNKDKRKPLYEKILEEMIKKGFVK